MPDKLKVEWQHGWTDSKGKFHPWKKNELDNSDDTPIGFYDLEDRIKKIENLIGTIKWWMIFLLKLSLSIGGLLAVLHFIQPIDFIGVIIAIIYLKFLMVLWGCDI